MLIGIEININKHIKESWQQDIHPTLPNVKPKTIRQNLIIVSDSHNMIKNQDDTLESNFTTRTIEQILFDFITALDEAIATYAVLSKNINDDPRPNQLLFCHIINSFDSFISSLVNVVILSDDKKLKEYFEKNTNLDQKTSLKEVMTIQEIGVIEWMRSESKITLEQDMSRKRHSQKLELLFQSTSINYKNIYVYLTGPGNHSTGCFKKIPTPESKKTVNHKTTSEKIIGYADILYEKRNAITHNRNNYPEKVIIRLNQDWGLKIDRSSVIIKSTSINAVIRFYTSTCLELLNQSIIKDAVTSKKEIFISQLNSLKEIKNIPIEATEGDSRFVNGGIEGRKAKLIESKLDNFNSAKYRDITGTTLTTTHRDLKKFVLDGFLNIKKRGVYSIVNPN